MSLDSRSVTVLALAILLPVEYFLRRKMLSTAVKRRIVRRAVGTVVSASAAWGMATAVDNGTTRAWAPALQIAWGITLLAAVFAAAFLFAQSVALAGGRELPFLRDSSESPAQRRAFGWTVVVGTVLIGVVLLASGTPIFRARLAMAGIGVFSIALAVLRPGGFWDAPRLRVWRASLGDAVVTFVYIGVGIAVVIWALTAHIE